mmetsp:Transcript_14731/g.12548  ORF Transcript_14731/g.12548 Transcript_14731/m.12548 type:complete len:80 (-) Transcript_14731:371-610(-)
MPDPSYKPSSSNSCSSDSSSDPDLNIRALDQIRQGMGNSGSQTTHIINNNNNSTKEKVWEWDEYNEVYYESPQQPSQTY